MREYKSEIWGAASIISALLVLFALFDPARTGFLGQVIVQKVLFFLFGSMVNLLPLLLALNGFFLAFKKNLIKADLRRYSNWTLGLGVLLLAELFLSDSYRAFVWPPLENNAGIPVYLIVYFLQKLIGVLGCYFLSLVIIFASAIVLLNINLLSLFKKENAVRLPPRRVPEVTEQKISPVKIIKKQRRSFGGYFQEMFNFSGGDLPEKNKQEVILKQKERPVDNKKNRAKVFAELSTLDNAKPKKSTNGYLLPSISLLKAPLKGKDTQKNFEQQVINDRALLENTLKDFKVNAQVVNVSHGPSVVRYELSPAPGVKVNKISNLADDISLVMASSVRIEAPVPGKSVVGIEVPSRSTRPVYLSELAAEPEFYKHPLTVALGLDIAGNPVFATLNEMPHLLIAGATGSGKSVCINSLIMSILLKATPQEVKFLLIDPKRVELAPYNNIPHLIAPVVDEPNMAQGVLKTWALREMERRYKVFAATGVRNIEGYNKYAEKNKFKAVFIEEDVNEKTEQVQYKIEPMPFIVIIIDELADLMMVASRDVEGVICRLAQMARATGIHLVIATQRPSVDVITGLIKANVPSRISFAVGSQIDSRTVLDVMGAEKLLGRGDMLYSPVGARHMARVQGVYVSDEEIAAMVNFVKRQAAPEYTVNLEKIKRLTEKENKEDIKGNSSANKQRPNERDDGRDVLFDEAAEIVQSTGRNSISYVQRKLRIGYNRAARIMDELIEAGIVNN